MVTEGPSQRIPDEALVGLVAVLDLVRAGRDTTRPELGERAGLGRTVVTQRVAQLLASGLLTDESLAPSTGGRPARALRFRVEAGSILVADLGATSIAVGITDLGGDISVWHEEPADVALGPEVVLARVEALFDRLLADRDAAAPQIWGVGLGVPGPVEYATGRPISPPIMPGWDGYPVRDRLAARYDVPAWVDNDANLMALGELRTGLARHEQDLIFLKIGSGIGAGLVSGGRMHRGAQGVAGDVGHVAVTDDPSVICRCGNVGCLEAVAGGAALGRQATAAARQGRSAFLARRLETRSALEATDLADAAIHGDPFAVELFGRTGEYIGAMLATLVNFFNPSLVIIGGGVASAGDVLLASIRQAVYRRSLALATRDLRVVRSSLTDRAGLHGAAFLVLDELFSRRGLARWIDDGTPASRPDIAHHATV